MLNLAGGADDSKESTTQSIVPELVQVIIDHNNFIQEVNIGTQTWLKNNLDVTTFRNRDPIPNITDDNTWTAATSGAYCEINNNPGNAKTFGRLYNGYVIEDPRGICPEGWHVPSADEWTTLMNYLGGGGCGWWKNEGRRI